MAENPYRVPLEQLEQERVLRTDQVTLVRADGGGPPPAGLSDVHAGGGGPDGDGD
jgi:hypothetical protein